ncbi:MAG: DUF58 domain-containing protein [Planctomycetes bacterium]|nr:DUF58 domain-containing protein [Planctomycetota bacterium]
MAKRVLGKYVQPEVLSRLRHWQFMPRGLVEGSMAGTHKSPFHGFAVEFSGHREYVPGDDIKHLDWKVYYRTDKHVIKQYEMETDMAVHLLLDVSASMRYGQGDSQKLLFAARAASILAYLVVEQSDKVSLALFDEEVVSVLAGSNSMAQIMRMVEILDKAKPEKTTKIGPPIHELAGRFGRRGIVVILSDLLADLDDLDKVLQRLKYDRHEVVLMHVMHHDELEFDMPGLVKFIGLEIDEKHLTRPSEIRDAYLEAVKTYMERLENICDANRCERVLCDTSRSMGELFADYLQSRTQAHSRW